MMLGLTSLTLMILCTLAQANFTDDAFDTFCASNKQCYYVSKFKTTWSKAQKICKAINVKKSTRVTKMEQTTLAYVNSEFLTRRHWIIQSPMKPIIDRKPTKITITIERKRRSLAKPICKKKEELIMYLNYILSIDWLKVINGAQGIDKAKWIFKFNNLIKVIKVKPMEEMNYQCLEKFRDIFLIFDLKGALCKKNYNILLEYVNFFRKWNWRELIKKVDLKDRDTFTKEIEILFIIIEKKEYGKINLVLVNRMRFIFEILQKLSSGQSVDGAERDRLILFIRTYIFNINWQKIISEAKGINNKDWIVRMNMIIELIKANKIDQIDWKFLIMIRENIHIFIDRIVIDYINILTTLNWKQLIQFVDVNLKAEYTNKILIFITFVEKKQFDKIDLNLLDLIRVITTTLQKVKETHGSMGAPGIKNIKEIQDSSNKYYQLLKDLKYEQFLIYVDIKIRAELTSYILTFIQLVEKKAFDKIDMTMINKIIGYLEILKKAKESKNLKCQERKKIIKVSNEHITLLKELKWQELIKDIDAKIRTEANSKITLFITLVESNKFDNIDMVLVDYITQIILTLKKIKEKKGPQPQGPKPQVPQPQGPKPQVPQPQGPKPQVPQPQAPKPQVPQPQGPKPQVPQPQAPKPQVPQPHGPSKPPGGTGNIPIQDISINEQKLVANSGNTEQIKKIITETSTKYETYLTQLKWEELMQFVDVKIRSAMTDKIRLFLKYLVNKDFSKIDVNFFNWLTETLIMLRKFKMGHSETINTIGTITMQQLPSNWEVIIKEIKGINSAEWIKRISYLKSMSGKTITEKLDYLGEVPNILRMINLQSVTRESKSLQESVKSLETWKWKTLLQYIDKNNQKQYEEIINQIISAVKSGKYDGLDLNTISNFNVIFQNLKQSADAIQKGFTYDFTKKAWTKTVGRKKRYLRMASKNEENFIFQQINRSGSFYHERMSQCPFMDMVDGELKRKLTDCELKQKFICKMN